MESLDNALNIALNLNADLTEEECNNLASAIMDSEQVGQKESVLDIAIALCNIGEYRISGRGYSHEVSDVIAVWIEKYFEENEIYTDKLVELIYELTSKESQKLPQRLMKKVNDKHLKICLGEAFCYMET